MELSVGSDVIANHGSQQFRGTIIEKLFLVKSSSGGPKYFFGINNENKIITGPSSPAYPALNIVPAAPVSAPGGGSRRTRRNKKRATRRRRA